MRGSDDVFEHMADVLETLNTGRNAFKPAWEGESIKVISARLLGEVKELEAAIASGDLQRINEEARDVTAYSMMIAQNAKRQMSGR